MRLSQHLFRDRPDNARQVDLREFMTAIPALSGVYWKC